MVFDFNLQSSLLIPPFIQGIVYFFLILFREKKGNSLSDIFLSVLLLLNSIKIAYWMLGFAGWYDTHDSFTSFMFYFPFNNVIIFGPVLYFYFKSLINTDFKIEIKHLKHFVLPIIWLLLVFSKFIIDFIFYYPFPNNADYQFGTKGPFAEIDKYEVVSTIAYLSFLYYLIITLKEYKDYKIYINENFSSTDKINFNWLRNMIYILAISVVIMFFFFSFDLINNGLSYYQNWYSYLFLGILTYYVSINGYHNNYSYRIKLQYLEKEKIIVEIVNNNKNTEEINFWKEKLNTFIEEKKSFLNPEITLSELSKALNQNANFISKIINEGYDINFNDFINYHRTQEFIKKIEKGEHKKNTLIALAYECGFNSKTTFNRAFKKIFLMTPIDYIHLKKY